MGVTPVTAYKAHSKSGDVMLTSQGKAVLRPRDKGVIVRAMIAGFFVNEGLRDLVNERWVGVIVNFGAMAAWLYFARKRALKEVPVIEIKGAVQWHS